jgi:Asp-tRNA(Asn)/Glu-tRNA(Gln) amidotransferase A subunit family amidase
MQRAAELDAELAALRANGGASLPSLFCVPLLVKDNIDAAGTATTAGKWGTTQAGRAGQSSP